MTSPTTEARLNAYSPTVLSIFRVMFGLLFTLHGSITLFGWPSAIPAGMAPPVGSWPGWWSGVFEFVTGLLVTLGLFTRIAAFIASGVMAVAYFWQHWLFTPGGPGPFWPFAPELGGNNGELAILFCFAFFLLVFTGGGAYALDARRRRRVATTAPGGSVGGWRRRFARR
jgi:putative oxidoreductase